MRKFTASSLFAGSIICSILIGSYFVLIVWHLAVFDGTYSPSTAGENGSFIMECGIPIFTSEDWLWTSFELFGAPILLLSASIRTAQVSYKQLLRHRSEGRNHFSSAA